MSVHLSASRRLAVGLAAVLTAGVLVPAFAAPADAGSRAKNTVTIKAEGVDLHGKVKSKRPACKVGRTVYVYKHLSDGSDHLFTTDIADEKGRWSGGNTGQEGTFFARVKKTAKCKAAKSPRIHAVRND